MVVEEEDCGEVWSLLFPVAWRGHMQTTNWASVRVRGTAAKRVCKQWEIPASSGRSSWERERVESTSSPCASRQWERVSEWGESSFRFESNFELEAFGKEGFSSKQRQRPSYCRRGRGMQLLTVQCRGGGG